MKRYRFVRFPLRRETAATRRLRARLARERQGPDGKWESNKKKKEVRIAKRKCMKLSNAFDAVRSKQLADEAAAFSIFDTLVAELCKIRKAAELRSMMPRLQGLAVTASLLRKSPSLIEALVAASKRCTKSKDASVTELVAAWQQKLQASRPRYRLSTKKAVENASKASKARPPSAESTVGNIVPPPRASPTPAAWRLAKARPSQKLGRMFANMRTQIAASEAESLKRLQEILPDLEQCASAPTLRTLLPRLQDLMVTASVLQQTPSLITTLESAAKRCRKGKDERVVRFLVQWRQLQKQQNTSQQENSNSEKTDEVARLANQMDSERSSSQLSSGKRPLPQLEMAGHHVATKGDQKMPPLKQRKITAFLNPGAVTTAGG